MVKSGDVLEHPITRERIVFRKTARDTGGELMQAEVYMQPGGFVAAEHIHPHLEERFEVISGTLRARVGGKELTGDPGERLVVPAGVPHVWWNSGSDELHVLVEARPALRFEEFFETFFGLAQDGKTSPKTGLPNVLQLAVTMREFRNELILAKPSPSAQNLLFGSLASVARLLGYRGEHPYPHPKQARI